jgi:Carboxymuconolactone decarboxylase family
MALNGSCCERRFVGGELVIDPIGTVFEPLEHNPAPFRSHLLSGECIADFVMPMLDWNGYRQQVLSGVDALGKLSPDTVKGYVTLGGAGQKTGRLDAKTRELIALAVAISLRYPRVLDHYGIEAKAAPSSGGRCADAVRPSSPKPRYALLNRMERADQPPFNGPVQLSPHIDIEASIDEGVVSAPSA